MVSHPGRFGEGFISIIKSLPISDLAARTKTINYCYQTLAVVLQQENVAIMAAAAPLM